MFGPPDFSLIRRLSYVELYTNMMCFIAPKISLYAGVLALGVGDSLAAIVGTKWGTHTWPGKLSPKRYAHSMK